MEYNSHGRSHATEAAKGVPAGGWIVFVEPSARMTLTEPSRLIATVRQRKSGQVGYAFEMPLAGNRETSPR